MAHTTFRGRQIDIDAMRRENENSVAVGNMSANARGDRIHRGEVTLTAEEIARANHRNVTMVRQESLKPSENFSNSLEPDFGKKATGKKDKKNELETPDGDIIMGDE